MSSDAPGGKGFMDSAQPARRGGRRAKSAPPEPAKSQPARSQPAAKAARKRQASAKADPAETTETVNTDKVVKLENLVMAQTTKNQESNDAKAEVTALSLPTESDKNGSAPIMASIFDRPIGPGAIEVYEEFSVAGMRPVAASTMSVYGTILNGRPIMASNIEVLELTYPGQRPVFASNIEVRDELTLPGGRPIVASDERLLDAELLPGGRPIASNDINNDMTDFIGYID